MEKFVHQQNLLVLRKQLATTPNEAQRLQLRDSWLKKKRRIRCRLNDSRPRLGWGPASIAPKHSLTVPPVIFALCQKWP